MRAVVGLLLLSPLKMVCSSADCSFLLGPGGWGKPRAAVHLHRGHGCLEWPLLLVSCMAMKEFPECL